jgi:hypothetical protein
MTPIMMSIMMSIMASNGSTERAKGDKKWQ